MKNNVILTGIIGIAVAAAAFFAGTQYQKSQANTVAGAGQFAQGNISQGARRFTGRGFGNATLGKIVSVDPNSITVQLQDGSSKIVNISDTTRLDKTVTASRADLTTGQTVAAFGSTNSDGSVTAKNIQLNPMTRPGRGQASSSAL